MAWAEQLPNGHWRACWRDLAGKARSTTRDPATGQRMSREAHAKRIAGDKETAARRGELGADGRSPSWGDWCPIWLAGRSVEPSTAAVGAYNIDKHIKPHWSSWKLNRITTAAVQAWVTGLAKPGTATKPGLSPATVKKIFRTFQSSLTAAVADPAVPLVTNPCAGVKLPTVAPGHERFLTRAEVEAIAESLNHPYRLAVLLAADTGLRWGELAGLHWQRVDLGTGLIDVVETWDPTAGRVKPYPKGKLRRTVPVPPRLAIPLGEARDAADQVTSCGQPHAAGGAKCRSGLVVPGPAGQPLNGKNFGRRQWADACARYDLGDVRLHDLRHTYASWLVQAGIPLQEVQRLLGHASSRTTERYAHLGTSQNDRVLAALSG